MINEIIYKKVGEWEPKFYRKQLMTRINDWLNQFDDNEKPEMLTLLENFDYYSRNRIPKAVVNLYKKFRQVCDSEDVVFVRIEKEIGTSHSNIFFDTFWLNNGLFDYTQDKLEKILYRDDLQENIVIVDDYFGTGETFIKYVSSLIEKNNKIKNKNLYFVALQGSVVGKEAIENYAKENEINLQIITCKYSKKAFEYDNIFKLDDADSHRQIYSDIYDRRNNINDYKFGYKEIEALVSFYYNTPNNTLGLFWQNIENFRALFERHERQKTNLNNMRRKTKQIKEFEKQKPFIRETDNEYKLDIFMVYCLTMNPIDIHQTCKDFGLTELQFNEMANTLLSKKYLIFQDGKYTATDLLKKYLYKSRVSSFQRIYNNTPIEEDKYKTEVTYIPKDFKKKFQGYKK